MDVWLIHRRTYISLFQCFLIVTAVGVRSPALSAPVDDFALFGLERIEGNIPAPPFSLADLQGKSVGSEDRHGKGLMLYFWASW